MQGQAHVVGVQRVFREEWVWQVGREREGEEAAGLASGTWQWEVVSHPQQRQEAREEVVSV